LLQRVTCASEEQWPATLAEFIRQSDEALAKASGQLLDYLTEQLLLCGSFDEFCDVVGLLGDISNPDAFLAETLQSAVA
jgi:E3 ubiquitin-protein ligase UBR4